ncbi:GNAT family N-acetyltransferase [Shewanella amazonensis]|uniref:Acetyltransferase, GNAT family n=1 Tax=Shewanella amazonensis (strain ATCC BAA-1098 / SB2B) TaxID=326297 RepID=A1S4K1_SHEAM|nr:GNAT family N-acetyltransferase [Shewanella amazonensis]ABL99307.1 acetyltransferase, GNAT family [Shewanella amazonensis SB2B]
MSFIADESPAFAEVVKKKIAAFNAERWDASQRRPIGFKQLHDNGELAAGIAGRTFGNWCLIDNFWVCDSLRGQGIGTAMLQTAEEEALARGCRWLLLDTLDFQAPAFYRRRGYHTVWCQSDYPFEGGQRFYMVKNLQAD